VAAGIDSIEHGSQIDAALAKEMKERGSFHVPTIAALAEIIGHPEDVPEYAVEKGKQIWDMAQDAFRRSIRAGVRIACGTDAGTPHNPHGSAAKEIVHMVEWGLTPLKALQAATSNAAALLRVDDVTGSVESGKAADLSLYDGDPLDDPTVLLRPASVWKGGEMVADGSGSLAAEG
jgi:imidazolonepropionase-like amidohydrolase